MTISTTLTLLFLLIIEKAIRKKDAKTRFESGFDTLSSKKVTFSTNFFMLIIMFLIFDVEISILIPFITINKNRENSIILSSALFICALAIILLKE
jgi:NADH:ubiquinone oxidoreductase subunit 3 (subunit A)